MAAQESASIGERVLQLLQDTTALLEGHFILTSGAHSERYIQCAKVLQYPQHAETLGRWLAATFAQETIDAVISPAVGGIVIGHEVARALGVRAIFGEREEGVMTLRRGLAVAPGERFLVVEDVTTTGGSVREIMRVVQERHGTVVGVGAILDRSAGQFTPEVPLHVLASLPVLNYAAAACPLCAEGSVAVKPGSRALR